MIINPIIPIWLMTIICISAVLLTIFNKSVKNILIKNPKSEKTIRQKQVLKTYIINLCIKVCIIILLFVINLRIMIPNGEVSVIDPNMNVVFVIDKTVSMRALDYDGNKERMEGAIYDCCHIVDKLPNCKYSIITFGNTAQLVVPFTSDSSIIKSELRAISVEDGYTAKGTTFKMVKNTLEETLNYAKERQDDASSFLVFFVSDGEITFNGEELESFSSIKEYIDDGVVMGYGTDEGGKMVYSLYENNPSSDLYYMYYYDEDFIKTIALSKIDENNLKQIASDIGIDYIHMTKTSNIDNKLNNIIKKSNDSQYSENKTTAFQDIYYYFAIPLALLLIIDFIFQKRRL